MSEHPELDAVDGDDTEYDAFVENRNRRIRTVAWVTIIALVLTGGGSTLLTLLLR